ncbi:MAG: superoxide dismutase family protein [Alphaproteobacteria bacterium]|nr:superoxide dismutase family protein [Alphaproteobacteria bacterium]
MSIRFPIILLGATALSACTTVENLADDVATELTTQEVGTASLSFANGQPAGTARLLSDGEQLSVAVTVNGMEPGPHGFHLHTTGACRAPDFTSAGGHLNPYNRTHGTQSPGGSHLGDMPNLQVDASGGATATVDVSDTPTSALEEIFDTDGAAVVVHAGADDYRTDPAGDAGSRIACGVLQRSS